MIAIPAITISPHAKVCIPRQISGFKYLIKTPKALSRLKTADRMICPAHSATLPSCCIGKYEPQRGTCSPQLGRVQGVQRARKDGRVPEVLPQLAHRRDAARARRVGHRQHQRVCDACSLQHLRRAQASSDTFQRQLTGQGTVRHSPAPAHRHRHAKPQEKIKQVTSAWLVLLRRFGCY